MRELVLLLTALTPLMVALTPIMLAAFAALTIVLNTRRDKRMDEVAALAKRTSELAADKVQEVARVAALAVAAAEQQSSKIMEKTNEIHTLVNSQYGMALALILEKAIRIHEISGDPKDLEEVDKAKAKLIEHESRQHIVDQSKK